MKNKSKIALFLTLVLLIHLCSYGSSYRAAAETEQEEQADQIELVDQEETQEAGKEPSSNQNQDAAENIPARMKLKAENEYLQLYLDEKLTDTAVLIKDTGDIWFSNPESSDSDPLANAYYKRLMKSQFSIRYYNDSVQSSEMDNYNDSILEEQFEIAYEDYGFTITYTLGEMADKLILPQVISEERFLSFYEKMESAVQKKVLRNYTLLSLSTMKEADKKGNLEAYPMLEHNNIYILKSGTKDYLRKEIMEYFVEAGYTAEELQQDNEENGFASENNKPWFTIPMTYKIDGENLLVSIDPNQITYNQDGYYLVNLDLLKFFGAAGNEEDGYIFVPDGSGALIHLDNQKPNASAYIGQVYGTDRTNIAIARKKQDSNETLSVKMPVFGLKSGNKAWFAIIEKGDAYASISAENAGGTNSYNNVYAGFGYMTYGSISMGDMIGAHSFQMYSLPSFTENYQIRFAFLSGDQADYSGMASYYRNYLIEDGSLTRLQGQNNVSFYVEFIGAIDKLKSVLGIKYNSTQSLTTFSQAEKIIEQLENNGIPNIIIQYSGWMNEGLESTAPSTVKVVSSLEKGGTTLKKFIQSMNGKGIPVYNSVDLQYVYKNSLFNSYTSSSHAPRYFDKSIVKTGRYLIPNGFLYLKDINLISPYYVNYFTDKFINKAKKLNLSGTAVGSLSSHLFSDYLEKRYTDREGAADYNAQAMKALSETYENGVLSYNTNAYALPYTKNILVVPMSSNYLRIIDEDVPFYEMVIRGYIDYAGEPLNLSDDYQTSLLKSVECGAGLYFKWIYEDNSKLKDTEYDYLYSVNYNAWLDKAAESYQKVNKAFSGLQGQCIVKHEKLQEKVYQVTYEQGTKVIVNYNNYSVTCNDTYVLAMDFAVVTN